MIHIFLNGSAASAGGGLTYLRNVIRQFATRDDVRVSAIVESSLRPEFSGVSNISFVDAHFSSSPALRFLQEQATLPRIVSESGAGILISAGNFALRQSPVPQILLSRNSLYTSHDFYRDLRERGHYALLLDTWIKGAIARKSVSWAECTVAPSDAFARELSEAAAHDVVTIRHGFDPKAFFADLNPLPEAVRSKLRSRENTLRLLFVSHYNYYRNFETLLRAIPLLRSSLAPRRVEVIFTCEFSSARNAGAYRTGAVVRLIKQLDIGGNIVELGAIPYPMLHHVYRASHVYVTPAYAESFAHPLVEAMACGLPVVAADRPVHREICGNTATYFPCFSPQGLAEAVVRVAGHPAREQLSEAARRQSTMYSWEAHVNKLLELAQKLTDARITKSRAAGSRG